MQVQCFFLPALATPEQLAGKTVVVIDILRATTTITRALSVGATHVVPCATVEDAQRVKEDASDAILGGERGGERIDGFDFGNSPEEYTQESVGNRTVAFTTTNGTRAMFACRSGAQVFLGSFTSLTRLIAAVRNAEELVLLCAGTDGNVTREDVLFAGAVIEQLDQQQGSVRTWELNDQAMIAWTVWRNTARGRTMTTATLAAELRESQGGKNLVGLGMESDIALAAEIDADEVLAELNPSAWQIISSRVG